MGNLLKSSITAFVVLLLVGTSGLQQSQPTAQSDARHSPPQAPQAIVELPPDTRGRVGAFPAAFPDRVDTGFPNIVYHKFSHTGATAWFVLAQLGYNPFWGEVVP